MDAHFGSFVVKTDQPSDGGGGNTAPTPFEMFLASLATCAGYYVLEFCRKRGISTDGLRLIQRLETDAVTRMASKILLEIQLPSGFPERYTGSVLRAAESCWVKKHLEKPPSFETSASVLREVTAN